MQIHVKKKGKREITANGIYLRQLLDLIIHLQVHILQRSVEDFPAVRRTEKRTEAYI